MNSLMEYLAALQADSSKGESAENWQLKIRYAHPFGYVVSVWDDSVFTSVGWGSDIDEAADVMFKNMGVVEEERTIPDWVQVILDENE